ncbi:PEP-CTERM protein-sorting domain-containing protein [Nitrosomonas aestuarii]|uniref:PEP-CTERM protein-sorting domain-containing protein n=1 Tax=Nitrosomonas aestuarii TaxID=52441 RepID=A0A1I4FD20_9PROT|nr:PEP-CTERM sorting domain-containing protein [Nitrosomonas aestuarii]SFL15862.1 PEP-CTERM protein-sorting domain-containing protein [Nitrosomonas aestuarii]
MQKIRISSTLLVCAVSMIIAVPVQAVLVNFQNFNDLSGFTLNGVTGGINTGAQGVMGPNLGDGRVLRLTNNVGQSGSAFLTNPFSLASDASFSSFFEFQFKDQQNGGADGIVFAIQTVANTAGGDGNNGNHAGININGNMNSVVRADVLPALLDSGTIFHAWVDYNGLTDLLEVRLALDDIRPATALMSHAVDLVDLLGTTNAFIGFTSGTGYAGADHDIRRWVFDGQFNPITDPGNPGGTISEPGIFALFSIALLGFGLSRRKAWITL